MMKAVMSGRACVAMLIDGDVLQSIHYDDAARLISRRPEEIRLLFGGARDLDFIENVDSVDDV